MTARPKLPSKAEPKAATRKREQVKPEAAIAGEVEAKTESETPVRQKVEKKTRGRRELKEHEVQKAQHRRKSAQKARQEGPFPRELEQTAAEYDQAIQGYAEYYRQEQGQYAAAAEQWGTPWYEMAEGYAGSTSSQKAGAASDEENLYLLEQAAHDFQAALPYIRALKGKEKTEYLASWKRHLTEISQLAAELIKTLEQSVTELDAADLEQ